MSRRKTELHKHTRQRNKKNNISGNKETLSWLYGTHTVIALLENPSRRYSRILTCDTSLAKRVNSNIKLLPEVKLEMVPRNTIDDILPEGAIHQGIAVLAKGLDTIKLEDVCDILSKKNKGSVIVLDQVTDPHNIGAIIRTAAGFKVDAIIVQDRHTPQITGVLAKSASGGLEHCPIVRITNLARALSRLKKSNIWCIGLDSEASEKLDKIKISGPKAIVLGAEGHGLRRLTRDACDTLACIPLSGPLKSLNVSNAAAIALYEIS
tara:strand:- start:1907 stop:2701 length:795 start_codon:yes stop_codon:yes gene_type:complete